MPKGVGYSHGGSHGKGKSGKLRSPFSSQKSIAGKGAKMSKKRGSSKRRK